MRRGDAFKSKYLKTEDLRDKDHLLTIASVSIETIKGQEDEPDEEKAVIFFKKADKGMVLNATNWDTLEEAYGEDSDDWANLPVILYPTTTKYRGKKVPCMRFQIPKGSQLKDNPEPNATGHSGADMSEPLTPPRDLPDDEPPPPGDDDRPF